MGALKWIIIGIGCGLMAACQQDPYFGPMRVNPVPNDSSMGKRGLVIGCEGNFQLNNASITRYYSDLDKVEQEVYFQRNSESLGDVLQSFTMKGDSLFVVMNNSGVIRILNDSSMEEQATITGLNSPRYIAFLADGRAVVTDFGSGQLEILAPNSFTSVGSVEVPSWTERMLVQEEMLWVAGMSDSTLLGLPTSIMRVESKHALSFAPSWLFGLDAGVLVCGNDADGWVAKVLTHDQLESWSSLDDKVFGVYMYDDYLYALTRRRTVILNETGEVVGGFDHDAQTPYSIYVGQEGVYVADVKDYVSPGEVHWYDWNFSKKKSIPTGFIPQAIHGF